MTLGDEDANLILENDFFIASHNDPAPVHLLVHVEAHKLEKEQKRSTLWPIVPLTFFVHQFTFHLNLKLKDIEAFDREGGAL